MSRIRSAFWGLSAVALIALGCGGRAPKETGRAERDAEAMPAPGHPCVDDGMVVEGLAGAVSEAEVDRVFQANEQRLLDCYGDAVEEVEEISGTLEMAIEVEESGAVSRVSLPKSDLGNVEAEECILEKVGRLRFSRSGCGIAYVTKRLSFDAPEDSDRPLAWGRDQAAGAIERGSGDISRCLGGRTGIHVVVYVGPGGAVLSSGAAADDADALDAARCLAAACRLWSFEDPGQMVAKLRLDF